MIVKACLRSGFCCRKGPCGFGESISDSNHQCKHLIEHSDTTTSCGLYEEISKHPMSVISPAFGSGCCMPLFNEARFKIRQQKFGGQEQFIEIKDSY